MSKIFFRVNIIALNVGYFEIEQIALFDNFSTSHRERVYEVSPSFLQFLVCLESIQAIWKIVF